nr:MAK10-like protein [Tanacetum cinerariifolium]
MGDKNPIRTLRDYSKHSHEGYRNTIEILDGNNVVPLRSDTIRLVQNGCSFHELGSEDPKQNIKDFLKLVVSVDPDVENRERTLLEVEKNVEDDEVVNESVLEPGGLDVAVPLKEVDKVNGGENRTKDEPVRSVDELVVTPSFQNVGYYLKHKINEKLIKGLVDNQTFNDSLSATRVGKPFLTTAKAMIKFDKVTITLRSEKNKISFHRMPEPLGRIEKGTKNDIEPISPAMTINKLILE